MEPNSSLELLIQLGLVDPGPPGDLAPETAPTPGLMAAGPGAGDPEPTPLGTSADPTADRSDVRPDIGNRPVSAQPVTDSTAPTPETFAPPISPEPVHARPLHPHLHLHPHQHPHLPVPSAHHRAHTPPHPLEEGPHRALQLEEHTLRALGLIRESHQTIHHHLEDLARETQSAAAAHGESLRRIHAAMQDLRRSHQDIVSRLNTQANYGQ